MDARDAEARDQRATASLLGLSTGDAYGNQFFDPRAWGDVPPPGGTCTEPSYPPGHVESFVASDFVPEGQWPWTDDTEMACGVVSVLRRHQRVEPDALARGWANHFQMPRDYGYSTLEILQGIRRGQNWRDLTRDAIGGAGSLGNGSAMRIAPLGAWYAYDLDRLHEEARLCCEITHCHPEGVAGGVAVAVAAALAAQGFDLPPSEFLEEVIDNTPHGIVQDGLSRARDLGEKISATEVAQAVGNGRHILTTDTVPLTVWIAAQHLDNYPLAVRTAVSAGGDMDTNAAIVGGIVAAGNPRIGVPDAWAAAREALPDWL